MKKIVISLKYLINDSVDVVNITVEGNVKLSEYIKNICYTYGDSLVSVNAQCVSC